MEYADLKVEQVVLEDQENAYFDLKELEGAIVEPDGALLEKHLNGELWEPSFVEETLDSNHELFEILDRASQKEGVQEPGFADISSLSFEKAAPTVTSMPSAARISALAALSLQQEGKETQAFEEILRTLKVVRMFQEAQGTMVHQVVAITTTALSLDTATRLLETSSLPEETLAEYRAQFEPYYEAESTMIAAIKVQTQLAFNLVDSLETMETGVFGSLTSGVSAKDYYLPGFAYRYYLHPNETKALLAANSRDLIERIQQGCTDLEEKELFFQDKSPLTLYFTENALGSLIFEAVQANPGGANWACERGVGK